MIRSSEIELHVRAKALFERENLGCVWNIPADASSRRIYRYANLIERQNYLARVREQMRAEGVHLEAGEENLLQPKPGR